jgi:hypothetical protein
MLSKEQERQLSELLLLPWEPHVERTEDSGIVMTIPEVPEFVAAADNDTEAAEVFWDALRAVLSDYLERGDSAPVPSNVDPSRGEALVRVQRIVWRPSRGHTPTGLAALHAQSIG